MSYMTCLLQFEVFTGSYLAVPYMPYRRGVEQVVDRAGEVLQGRGIRSTSIVGGRTRQERSSAVSLFTTDPSIKVILLTTGSAAAGAFRMMVLVGCET